ncbi:MAG: FHA domain-containing protein [Acidobacteriota bacterium]
MSTPRQTPDSPVIPILSVRTADGRVFRFSHTFYIGREVDCDVHVEDAQVSRKHVMVSFEHGQWRIHNQRSGNGVFVNGRRVETASIGSGLTIRLGAEGPSLLMELESRPPAPSPAMPRHASETMIVAQRYFGKTTDEGPAGGHTMMIRKAFHTVQKKQKRLYWGMIALAVLVALAAGGYAYRGRRQMIRQQEMAQDLFYAMKSLDVNIANLQQRISSSGNSQGRDQLAIYTERRRQMERSYDSFLSGLKFYDHALTAQEQLVLRVTRVFGEYEVAAPPEYLAVVASYIRKWRATPRYANAVNRAQTLGYTRKIVEELQKQDLPPQFFYLAMQESDFDEAAIGSPTRWGIAKGMWQFIPETAGRYGLTIGPLAAFPRADPVDDRHKWDKSTRAAALYIKDIYATDAQASGLLVMASYNWGEHRIIDLLRTMPANPKERNFWKVLERHRDRIPKETYDYVMSIVSAAVIGENPRLFGFSFDNPLNFVERQ